MAAPMYVSKKEEIYKNGFASCKEKVYDIIQDLVAAEKVSAEGGLALMRAVHDLAPQAPDFSIRRD